jgi:glycosyltransferase involved in cell wall biosynthesis
MIRELLDGGGFSIVHDSRMFEYYYFDHSEKGGSEFKAMAEYALRRPVREEDIQKWLADPRQLPSLFLDDILDASSNTVVHHPGFARELESRYNVRSTYIPFAISDALDDLALTMDARIRARALLGRSPDTPLIVSFGYVAPVKGPIECIYALSELHDWNLKAELHFVGKADPSYQALLEGIARRCGVEQHVFFSNEFLSTEKYKQYLLAADVAIQPRKVGFGQGSGAVAECASVGLVTVANENVADSVEAPDYVLRVPDVLSPTLIAERVLEAYESGSHLSRVSAARAEYVDQHSFDRYAKTLLQKLTSCA